MISQVGYIGGQNEAASLKELIGRQDGAASVFCAWWVGIGHMESLGKSIECSVGTGGDERITRERMGSAD